MRVDLFLKQSRLVKRRPIAKELCDEGAVKVNGRTARAGQKLVVGDSLTLSLWSRRLELEVLEIPGASSQRRVRARPVPDRIRESHRLVR